MTVVIGTAGHIDHGKTTLLRALTGIDADRLPEERARGMTIDVGYAHLILPDGSELDFVDVPGHDRLVGNMLVGAGEIDAALLVIAGDDGPRAQTREHLELLDALGIEDGLIAVTKSDAVRFERVHEAMAEARALVASTTLRDAALVAVSAASGDGVDAVRDALVALRDRLMSLTAGRDSGTASRLAVDRVFSIRGRGTVVTGTLRGAPIERGASLRVLPGPKGRTVRVREVQVHGKTVERAGQGRVALNLAGEPVDTLERGMILTTDPEIVASDRLLVALRPVAVLPGASVSDAGRGRGRDLPADRARVTVHIGTARVTGVVGRDGRDDVDLGGGERSAILRLDRPVAVGPGDRLVLRRQSPVETVAGGRVLDPQPARGARRRRTNPERLRALAAAAAGTDRWRTARLDLHGSLAGGPFEIAPDVAIAVDDALLALVHERPRIRTAELIGAGAAELRRRLGSLGPSRLPGGDTGQRIAMARVDGLVATGRLIRVADRLTLSGVVVEGPSPALAAAMDRLVRAISTVSPAPLATAALAAGCPPEGIRLLEQANLIVRLDDDLAWALPAWRDLATQALALATAGPLTPAAFRDATGTSRKYVMAILEDLDRRAILRRTPDGHVPGPRAAQLATPDRGQAVDVPAQ